MQNASQVDLVTIALYLLQGAQHVVDTEDIAVKVHELAPGRFAWKKYPDQINLELVRVYLSAAKDLERGAGFVEGTGRVGWTLTEAGLKWAKANAEKLVGRDLTRSRSQRRGGSVDEYRWRRERSRIIGTSAWAKWSAGMTSDISPREASEVFRIDSYAVGRTLSLKLARLREMFESDDEVGPFLNVLIRVLQQREAIDAAK